MTTVHIFLTLGQYANFKCNSALCKLAAKKKDKCKDWFVDMNKFSFVSILCNALCQI